MPRVLLVLHEDTLGGASRAVLRPAEALRERGWELSIWCSRPSPLYDELVELGHDVAGAPRLMRYRPASLRDEPGVRARLASFPRSLAAFHRHLRRRRPDLVHVNGRLALPEGLVARAGGFRVFVWIHDDTLPGARGRLGTAAPWLAGHAVAGVSERHAAPLRLGRRAPAVVFPSPPPQAPLPRAHRAPGAPLVIGTVGVLVPRKGTDLFVEMAERLLAEGSSMEFRVAGGKERSHLATWAEGVIERGEAAGVQFLGHTDVARELSEWDLMVMPARADPFPLAVLEAMHAGVPVVGTRVEGIPEQLGDGAGVLVDSGDAEALARAVRELAADPDRREAIARRARDRVGERFTPERTVDALERIWRTTAR